jgi:methylated-DNA-[protein]-cysteine S-methyltransferase
MTTSCVYTYLDSPIGSLLLAGRSGTLEIVRFPNGRMAMAPEDDWRRDDGAFGTAKRQLDEYFGGLRRRFDLPMAPRATPFQARVLAALQRIPYGETRSYKDIACAIGEPRSVRAVGGANGRNPLPIVIPCHRVIGSGGQLTGFGGGIETKRFLLDLERAHSGLFAD